MSFKSLKNIFSTKDKKIFIQRPQLCEICKIANFKVKKTLDEIDRKIEEGKAMVGMSHMAWSLAEKSS
jgi:hypothetical protein